ncbi:MAG TPA: HDIG domain-containing protein [Mobilitalea sp.]|nr:HDIG domain-containing protein [Mobilitalea sp.]
MKIKDDNSEKDISKSSKETAVKAERNNSTPVMITILPFLAMLTAILPDVIYKTPGISMVKIGIITLLLTGAVSFYIRENADDILDKKLAKTIITLSYLSSICLLLFVPNAGVFSFWMLGGLLVSMLIDQKLGLLLHFNLSFIMGITLIKSPEQVIQVLIMGVLMSMLSGALRQKSTVIYAAIIILSTNITISFAVNNLLFDKKSGFNYMYSLFSILIVLILAFFISMIFSQAGNNKEIETQGQAVTIAEELAPSAAFFDSLQGSDVKESDVKGSDSKESNSKENDAKEKVSILSINQEISEVYFQEDNLEEDQNLPLIADPVLSQNLWTSYDVLCDKNNVLLQNLKQHSEGLYEHALYIGDLSCRAAKEVGANEMLALAGGFYHEIGKINGKNYIEEGLLIAEEYAFPKELTAILKEHNIKYEKPGSIEAAIVMLSDSVVSTIEYIAKSEEHKFTKNKIIDNIFQMRMDKGTFDTSSLSLKDYKLLKNFYKKEFGEHGQA